jgi:NADPH:quinone reductase-like Zn-dependent oxidoreductase
LNTDHITVAANPVDWKIQDYGFPINKFPTVLGSDSCGVIVAIGNSVTKFKVRDRVAGFAGVIYNQDINHGAFQSYTLLRDIATTKIPDNMSFEEGPDGYGNIINRTPCVSWHPKTYRIH